MAGVDSTTTTLDREFLTIRARLIDLAAMLDRLDRAQDAATDDPRLASVRRSLEILAEREPGRVERIQLGFSLPYDENWHAD